ncbi:MAG TPA: GntR family transcriptional regulator [Marinagarivorans sp.]
MNNLAEQQCDDTIEKDGISRVEWVYRTLKQSILTNEFYPGYQALEPELAKSLGVSRTPVREALIRLENERLIELIPRRGMRVIPLVPEDMREIYELLTSLEVTAVEMLARKRPTRSALADLEQAIDDMETCLADDNREGWAEADDRFHRLLVETCGNSRLAAMASSLRDQGHRARLVTLKLREKPTQSNRDHRNVIEAIIAGDWEKASEIHYSHRRNAAAVLVGILEDFKLPHL